MYILIIFLTHWFLSIFCQTFFLHRYASHKMFTMSKPMERCFHLLTYLCQGGTYLVPRAYAIMHRMHHSYSDTAQDPHSPYFFKNIFSMMHHTRILFINLCDNKIEVNPKFLGNYPEWDFIDKLGNTWISRIFWDLFILVLYIIFATHWWMYLLLPIHFLMGPLHGALVNWFGHKYGYSNYDNKDFSKNTLFFDIFLGGELFQNNHHKHPNNANFAVKWWEFDITYPVIRVLHFCRIIKLRKI
jgi:stearoyl-CoA desaturase (delta-9 desaturase)